MSTINIQPLAISREDAFSLYAQSLRPYIEAVYGWDEKSQRERFAGSYPSEGLFSLYRAKEDIGLLALRGPGLHVALLLIRPEFQNQGLGREVMAELHNRNQTITLSSFKLNTHAVRFYQALGYTIIGEDEHFYDLSRPANQE